MKTSVYALIIVATLLPLAAQALDVRPGFNASVLIPDASFSDTRTFGGPEGIQRFLESKGSVLANTSAEFLANLSEPSNPALKQTLDDPQPNLGRLRTAAELIWDASRASGINPQVILVTLHKEQSLIGAVSNERLSRALRNAMGFACPDALGCGDLFPGFYSQLFGNVDLQGNRYLGAAKSLMKSFNTPGGRGPAISGIPARVGETVQIGNTMGDYSGIPESQQVTIGNSATAALYRYTPHVFNGNYNFWNFFTSWFKYPNGTLLKSTQDANVYIIRDGQLQRVPAFVAVARALNTSAAIAASPTELDDYPRGGPYGPTDNTVISLDGKFHVFIDGIKRPASSFVLTQRKLDPAQVMPITAADAALFSEGPQLTPSDGTVLKADAGPDIYLVDKGVLKKYSWFTFTQHKAAAKLQIIPADEVASYPKDGYVAPLNGTLIKSRDGASLYVMNESRRLPLTAELIKNLAYNSKKAVVLETDDELASIPVGPPATPRDSTYFMMGKEFFLFKGGSKHPIFPFVAKQRGMKSDFAFESSIAGTWPDGIAIPPNDGTLIKAAGAPAIYVTVKGQLRPLTEELFKLGGYRLKNVVTLADAEVTAFAKGPYAEPPDNTYFSVTGTDAFYRFEKGTKRRIYSFVAKQRGMKPDHSFNAEVADGWTLGTPIAPREGALLKAEGTSNYFLVSKTVVRPITDAAMVRRGLKKAKALTVPAADMDGFDKGETITK